jgi:hypothetical protein
MRGSAFFQDMDAKMFRREREGGGGIVSVKKQLMHFKATDNVHKKSGDGGGVLSQKKESNAFSSHRHCKIKINRSSKATDQ